MTENNEQNHDRNNKKLFQKGGLPGPGRGKKTPLEPLTLEQIEASLQKDLSNSDPKIRHNATKIYLMLKKQMGESKKNQAIDPNVQQALQGYTDDLFSVEDIQEVDEDDITN
jgi:hypothetical protein